MIDLDMEERYRRAGRELPSFVAPHLTGNAIEGYWVDAETYFFVNDHRLYDGRIMPLPFMAKLGEIAIQPLIKPERLLSLLHFQVKQADEAVLAPLSYDYPAPGILAVNLPRRTLLINVRTETVQADIPSPDGRQTCSPCGRFAVSVAGYNLRVTELATGEERAVTRDGVADWPYGQQPQSSLSTLAYRRRPYPVALWSDSGNWLLTHRIDERHVPERALVENAPINAGKPLVHRFRYATATDDPPLYALIAIHVTTGRIVLLPQEPVYMFPSLLDGSAWFVGDSQICRIRRDLHHRHVQLLLFDLATGAERLLFEERSDDCYLDLHPLLGHPPNVRYMPETDEVIWWSERDGWGHLYLIDARTQSIIRQITQGEWLVRDLVDIDPVNRTVLFTAVGMDPLDDPMLRSLAKASLNGSEMTVISEPDGHGDVAVLPEYWSATAARRPYQMKSMRRSVSPDRNAVVIRRTAPNAGSITLIQKLGSNDGMVIATGECSVPVAPPVWLRHLAADGVTRIDTALYLPRWHDGSAKLPIIDVAYPGPQSVFLPRSWWNAAGAQAQALAELGFAAFVTDSRGLPFRSRALRRAGYGNLLEPQMADHVSVIDQLCGRFSFLDKTRIGIVGSSAGGAAAAYAVLKYPETYHAAVALCGPYDPADYLNGWMLKFVGPDVGDAWLRQSIVRIANRLDGRLLLIHGEMDDNVHPSHTMRLADALVAANKRFDLLLVPGESHLLQLGNPYVQQRIWDFFTETLLGETPPVRYRLEYEPSDLVALARVQGREASWS